MYRKFPSKSAGKATVKRPTPNPKYQHIQPVINSGLTIRRYLDQIAEQERYARGRKHDEEAELRRIKMETFIRLLVQVEIDRMDEEISEHGKRPYLLLDVRLPDQFTQQHIYLAENYPKRLLSRVMNYESASMLQYKNQSGEVIVVYDEDESVGRGVAATLTQRGYDNVYLLSGGLKLLRQRFPQLLRTGTDFPLSSQDGEQLLSQLLEEGGRDRMRSQSAASCSSLMRGQMERRPWK